MRRCIAAEFLLGWHGLRLSLFVLLSMYDHGVVTSIPEDAVQV